jgi:hypothetical protein
MHSVGELLPNEEDWKDMENKDWKMALEVKP